MKLLKKAAAIILAFVMLPCVSLAAQYPFEELEVSAIPRIERLISLCGEKGIETAYEKTALQTIKDSVDYGKEIYKIDENKGNNVLKAIQKLASDTENDLNNYLSGKAAPKDNVEFAGGSVELDGYSFIGNTNKGERPVFSVGYNNAKEDIDKLDKYGINLIQTELGPYSYIMPPSEAKWHYEGDWGDGCRLFLNTADFCEGASCLEITNPSGGDMFLYQDIFLPAGSYSLKYYARGVNVSGGGIKYISDGEEEVVRAFNSLEDEWKQFGYNFVLRSAKTVRIAIDASARSDSLMIDDMTLTKNGTDYILQGGFEYDFCYGVSGDDPNNGIGTDYAVSFKRYLEEIEPVFDKAAEKDIKVDFIISPHYFPQFLKNQGLGITWNTSYNSFLTYDIYSETAKAAIEEYLKFILPEISQKESLMSICLSNEPKYQIAYIDGFFEKHPEIKEKWIVYLTGRYNDISELNEVYGGNYQNFSQVGLSLEQSAAQKYDTVIFNAQMLSEWHSWLASLVREYAPGIPVHTKQMKSISDSHGMHPERAVLGGYADLGGNDAYNLYYTGVDYATDKMLWYDFIASFNKAPVFDSENHIISDTGSGATPYRKEVAQYVSADIWQGAIHARSATTLWAWEKSFDKSNIFYDSLGTRPDAVAAVAKTTKDLNRLSEIVSGIQNQEPKVGILYSEASAIYESSYNGSLTSAYKLVNESGRKAGFISENQISEDIPYEILVIPKSTYYTDEATVAGLNAFAEAGGVIISYSGNFKYNTKTQPQTAELSDKAVTVSDNNIKEIYLSYLSGLGLDNAVLWENENRAEGIDYKSVVIDGKTYVNICNYTFSEKAVSMTLGSHPQFYAHDLISGKAVNPSLMVLKPYTPLLLETEAVTSGFISGFTAAPEAESVLLAWRNIDDFSEKYLTVYDGNDNIIFSGGLEGGAEEISVEGLISGAAYMAELSDGTDSEEIAFRTKRPKNTSSFIKGWTLEYRGNDPYVFDEGEFAVVSNESYSGNSSLKLTMFNSRQSMLYYQLWRDVYLQAGTTYRYTVRYKLENYGMECNANPKFSFYADDRSNGKEVIIRNSDGTWNSENGVWYSASFDFTPERSKNYRFSLIADSGGTIWLDDLSIYALADGEATGENLLGGTASKIGGGFEAEEFCTVPEPPLNTKGEFLGGRELLLSWTPSEEESRVNIYREENGERVLVSSTSKNHISVYSEPYAEWSYWLTTVDKNENESEPVLISGRNAGNVSAPRFYSDGIETAKLTDGELTAEIYAFEEADLYLALYEDGRLKAIKTTSGTGRLTASVDICEDNLLNKKAVAFVWKDSKPLRAAAELVPAEQF